MNKSQIANTIKDITTVTKQLGCEYRIIGSLIAVANSQELYRQINDIDIFIDHDFKQQFQEGLKQLGYQITINKIRIGNKKVPVSTSASKPNAIRIHVCASGYFADHFIIIPLTGGFSLRISNKNVLPQIYEFDGLKFVGTPLDFLAYTYVGTRHKPYRSEDLARIKTSAAFRSFDVMNLYWRNFKIPLVYDVLFRSRDWLGWYRLKVLKSSYYLFEGEQEINAHKEV